MNDFFESFLQQANKPCEEQKMFYDTLPKDEWLSIAQKATGSVVEVEGVKMVQIGEWRFLAEAKGDNNQKEE